MNNNIPYFEVDGVGYAIKRNRYLQAEFDEIKKSLKFNEDEEIIFEKAEEIDGRLKKLRQRKDELYDKYLESFSAEDEEIYMRAESAYNSLLEQSIRLEDVSGKRNKALLDCGEQLIIKALQIDKDGNDIRTHEEAKNIWQDFVGECGQSTAIQFIVFTINYIVGGDEEVENPFIAQAKAKAEQKKANMRKGIEKAN